MRYLLVNLILSITLSAYAADMTPYIADMIPTNNGYLCKAKFSDGIKVSYKLLANKYKKVEPVKGFSDSGEYIDDVFMQRIFVKTELFTWENVSDILSNFKKYEQEYIKQYYNDDSNGNSIEVKFHDVEICNKCKYNHIE